MARFRPAALDWLRRYDGRTAGADGLAAVIVTIAANGWMMTRTLGGIMFFLYFLFVLQDLLRNFLGCSGGGGGTC